MKPLAAAVLLLLVVGACQDRPAPTAPIFIPLPPGPETVTISVAGSCEVEGSSINCRDDSTSSPAGRLREVLFTLRRGSATVVASETVQPGDTHSFGPGLASATYAVDHQVFDDLGGMAETSYSNLVIP